MSSSSENLIMLLGLKGLIIVTNKKIKAKTTALSIMQFTNGPKYFQNDRIVAQHSPIIYINKNIN